MELGLPVCQMDHQLSEEFLRTLGKHSRQIYACVYSMVLNKNDADDIIQETNLVLWREFSHFEPGSNFLAWARTIATNQVLAWKTRQRRDRHVFGDEFIQHIAQETQEISQQLSDRSEFLHHCLDKLSEQNRQLISQRYDEEQTVEQLAAQMGRSSDAIYRALSRIRKMLHECVNLQMKKTLSR